MPILDERYYSEPQFEGVPISMLTPAHRYEWLSKQAGLPSDLPPRSPASLEEFIARRNRNAVFIDSLSSDERKELPLATGCLDYFQLALLGVARISKQGNDKHNPGQPLHWARSKSSDHADCEARHLLTRQSLEHKANKAWRALADLQEAYEAEIDAGRNPFQIP